MHIDRDDGEYLSGAEMIASKAIVVDDEVAQTTPRYRFSRKLVEISAPGSAQAESIGALRAHMMAQHIRDKRRALAICAASDGVGTSYVTANLAVGLSMAGIKTLLIDANLREPGLEALIQPTIGRPGLVQCLGDSPVALGDAIHDRVLPNLSVIYSGGAVANPQELLVGANLKAIVDMCTRDFDITLIDTAPSNGSADARRVAALVRYAMIVVRRNKSFVSDAKLLAEELKADRVTVIGTYLNDF